MPIYTRRDEYILSCSKPMHLYTYKSWENSDTTRSNVNIQTKNKHLLNSITVLEQFGNVLALFETPIYYKQLIDY